MIFHRKSICIEVNSVLCVYDHKKTHERTRWMSHRGPIVIVSQAVLHNLKYRPNCRRVVEIAFNACPCHIKSLCILPVALSSLSLCRRLSGCCWAGDEQQLNCNCRQSQRIAFSGHLLHHICLFEGNQCGCPYLLCGCPCLHNA